MGVDVLVCFVGVGLYASVETVEAQPSTTIIDTVNFSKVWEVSIPLCYV